MDNEQKFEIVSKAAVRGGVAFSLLSLITDVVPGRLIGGVPFGPMILGCMICGGIAALIVYMPIPKE